jgi:biopolymer transport protein ExbB/TolQ
VANKDTSRKAKPRNEAQASSKRRKTAERHAKNREDNQARHKANLAEMARLGISPERVTVERRVNTFVTKTQSIYAYAPTKTGGGTTTRSVRPSKLLRQARRAERA